MPDGRAALRVSVRAVAAFAGRPEDIRFGAQARQMLEGALAHQAFQRAMPADARAEAPLNATFCRLGERVTLHGRADALTGADTDCPAITEVKRPAGGVAPDEPHPEHAAQALLYAFLLVCGGALRARVTVSYVNLDGAPLASFTRALSWDDICAEAYAYLDPCIAWEASERNRREKRDASILALPFPYAAYRAGQRELAAQVYTAITQRKRLFASLPTGTGKSAATLFPALKALALGKTRRVLYLTARTTARQSPFEAMRRMTDRGLCARALTLTSKEKLCPGYGLRCHPDACPRARGHYLREPDAVAEIRQTTLWTEDVLRDTAERHALCPFEFSMTLTLLADVIFMDYNFAFDPVARIQRLIHPPSANTFLVDEAHHLPERGRDMLSGALSSGELKRLRAAVGRDVGRRHPLWHALGECARALEALREAARGEGDATPQQADDAELTEVPERLERAATALCGEAVDAFSLPMSAQTRAALVTLTREVMAFCFAAERARAFPLDYALLASASGKDVRLSLYCLLPAPWLRERTHRAAGAVFFSATLTPLSAMKQVLGGEDADACFALPSPFPKERLLVMVSPRDTRYRERARTAGDIARDILAAASARPGKYIAYFPSYAYLRLVLPEIEQRSPPPLCVQSQDMDEAAREAFLARFTDDGAPLLGLCVLGGAFAEGVDLPSGRLIGAMIVGVGLATPSRETEALRARYADMGLDGFAYAFQYPGMHKVLQAAGRVIRSETDAGVVLLIDERYRRHDYRALCPPDWAMATGDVSSRVRAFARAMAGAEGADDVQDVAYETEGSPL